MTLHVLQERRDDILAIAKKRRVVSIRVFGSVARGDDRPESDVDFLVELEPDGSLFDLGGLQMDLSGLLGVDVDVVTAAGLKERIRERVMDEAVAL